jgi:AcrR family transcriptional regulator
VSSTARDEDETVEGTGAAAAAGTTADDPDGDGPDGTPGSGADPDVVEVAVGPGGDDRAPLSRSALNEGLAHLRALHERDRRPDEGLRERKKRLTRQAISDTATWMFVERGFDEVRVSEVAAEAGVSEKTVFNYFPTKESLVFDRTDDLLAGVRAALTDRGPDESPTQAFVAFIERETAHFDELGADFRPMFLAFVRMIEATPSLRAVRRQISVQLVEVARDALAASVGVDPRDPEPFVAAQALMGLWEVQIASRQRHIREGIPVGELRDAVMGDVRRAARLLDTGLWSFNQVAQGASARSQLADAGKAANEARKQVFEALRQARAAWSELRTAHDDTHRACDGPWWDRRTDDEAPEDDRREAQRDRRRAASARRLGLVRLAREEAEARGQTKKAEKLAEAERRMVEEDARRGLS